MNVLMFLKVLDFLSLNFFLNTDKKIQKYFTKFPKNVVGCRAKAKCPLVEPRWGWRWGV